MHILIVDNFDSFTNNIAQYVFEATGQVPIVVPNTTSLKDLNIQKFSGVILSPGPGHPNNEGDFGVCREIIDECQLPILGICLGHQGINCQFGGVVSHAPRPVHGYRSKITHNGNGLFAGIPQDFEVVRYHSLVCTQVADCLEVTASSEDGLVMGIAHREKPIWGIQFHPESIDSEYGATLIENYIHLIQCHHTERQRDLKKISQALESAAGVVSLSMQYERLNISSNAADAFTNYFAHKSSAFWLDSELSEGQLSRYSVMGSAQPNETISFAYDVNKRKLSILGPLGEGYIYGDYFELMDQLVVLFKPERFDELPFPFQCGLIGYLGYELKALAGTENRHQSSTPDALFFLPQNMLVFDHAEDAVYLCHLWGKPMTVVVQDEAGRQERTRATFIPGAISVNALELEDSVEQYIEKIHHCLTEIRNGESYEICLTNRARMPFEGDVLRAYLNMRSASPVPYGAFIRTPEFSILSASPETFLKVNACRTVSSKPIKGTRPRGATIEEDAKLKNDLARSEKDRAENLMIVDLVRHDLNSVCLPGTVRVPKAFDIETYSSVHQLVSTIEGKLKPCIGPFGVIKACFPGGSMTGAPKLRTMAIIDKLEASARGIYSGALGWVGMDGVTNLSIVIRTAVVQKSMGEFGIGGAIVAASSPDEEMEETLVKASVPFYSLSAE